MRYDFSGGAKSIRYSVNIAKNKREKTTNLFILFCVFFFSGLMRDF